MGGERAAPRIRRHIGLCLGAAGLLLAGCAQEGDTDAAAGNGAEPLDKPQLTRPLLDAAVAAEGQGDCGTATNYYRAIFSHDAANAEAAAGLMSCLRILGQIDEARDVAKKALAASPKAVPVLAEAGKVRLAAGEPLDAIKLLERAADADAKDWRTPSALGLAYDRLADYAKADQYYEAALKLSPNNPAVLNNYGLSRALAGDLAAAKDLLQRAAAAPGADIRVRHNLALLYALSGNELKAEELTRRDLPPAVAGEEVKYIQELAAAAEVR